MYLALFLLPWVAMYALSTMAMNHRSEDGGRAAWVKEREITWSGGGWDRHEAAGRLLAELGLDGAHTVSVSTNSVVIQRLGAVEPRRITWTPMDGRVVVERQQFGAARFLERMHRRRGYEQPYTADTGWAVTVDLFIFALVFWGASGLWLWWEMKKTRLPGAVCLAAGAAVFALFLAVA